MKEQEITLTQLDHMRLSSLLNMQENIPHHLHEEELEELQVEIDRARIKDSDEIPCDLITMNSHFTYLDVTHGKAGEMTIVYPKFSNTLDHKISVLAPLGIAMLGLREGEEIDWKFPDGQVRKLRILKILFQPEANGDLNI